MNTVSKCMLWKTEKNPFQNKYSFRIDDVVENKPKFKNEYSLRIDDVVEDKQESLPRIEE